MLPPGGGFKKLITIEFRTGGFYSNDKIKTARSDRFFQTLKTLIKAEHRGELKTCILNSFNHKNL